MSPPSTTAPGEVRIEGDHATLYFRRHLKHPPEAVWEALTDPAQLRQWFMTVATIDGRPGGSVHMVSGPARFEWTGDILAWEPHRLYEYEWNTPPHPHLPQGEQSVVRWELEPKDGGTLLTLTHRRLTKGTALGFVPGTHAFLDRLEAQLAGDTLPDWQRRYQEVAGHYPSWRPPQG